MSSHTNAGEEYYLAYTSNTSYTTTNTLYYPTHQYKHIQPCSRYIVTGTDKLGFRYMYM